MKNNHNDLGAPLCSTCLAPLVESRHFCIECGAPSTSVAVLDPLRLIESHGFALRRGTTKPTLIVLVGMWIIFFPLSVSCLIVLFGTSSWNAMIFVTLLLTIYISILAKVTRNYSESRSRFAPRE